MGWRKSAGILALAIVTGWSIAGTVCAAICASAPASSATAASAHHHHQDSSHGAGHVEHPAPKVRFHVATADGCGNHDDALLQASATIPDRTERQIVANPSTNSFFAASALVMASAASLERRTQSGNSPPPAFSPILRV